MYLAFRHSFSNPSASSFSTSFCCLSQYTKYPTILAVTTPMTTRVTMTPTEKELPLVLLSSLAAFEKVESTQGDLLRLLQIDIGSTSQSEKEFPQCIFLQGLQYKCIYGSWRWNFFISGKFNSSTHAFLYHGRTLQRTHLRRNDSQVDSRHVSIQFTFEVVVNVEIGNFGKFHLIVRYSSFC